jgi:AraC-like DNA-binding protein
MNKKYVIKKAAENFTAKPHEIDLKKVNRVVLDEMESGFERYSIKQEMQWIRHGRVDLVEEAFKQRYPEMVLKSGTFSDDFLQHFEYSVIMAIALCAHEAEENGVNPRTVYALRDDYLQKVSVAGTIQEYYDLCYEIILTYTTLIRDAKVIVTGNHYVDCAKNYIREKISEDLTVDKIAQSVNISPEHLTRLFRKHAGIPIKKYIMNQKLKTASELLIYSDYTILDIAKILGFSSQSHFGKVFKQHTGETPLAYRSKNKR